MNWRFPKIVVAPNHLFLFWIFHSKPSSYWGRWQELDDRLQEQVVQKNHLLQVLNKEDLEGAAAGAGLRYTFIFYSHSSFDFIYIYIRYMIHIIYIIIWYINDMWYIYIWSMILYYYNYVLIDWFAEIKKGLIPQRVRSIPQVGGGSVGCQEHCWHGALVRKDLERLEVLGPGSICCLERTWDFSSRTYFNRALPTCMYVYIYDDIFIYFCITYAR